MKFTHVVKQAAAVTAMAMSAPMSASAQFTSYTDLGAFQAAVGTTGTDGYDGFNLDVQTLSPLNRNAGAFSYTVSAPINFFGAGTSGDPWLSTNNALNVATFNNFGTGIFGVGGNFFTSDIAGAYLVGDMRLEATDINGLISAPILLSSTTTSTFFAFTSVFAVASLRVSSVQPGTGFIWPTIDNFVLAEAARVGENDVVPEPATMTLLATGLAGMAAARRRKAVRP